MPEPAPPYRTATSQRARIELAAWTRPRLGGRLGAAVLLAVTVALGTRNVFADLRCHRAGELPACSLSLHRILGTQRRVLDVSGVNGVSGSDALGFTLVDTERMLVALPRSSGLILPRRGHFRSGDDARCDDWQVNGADGFFPYWVPPTFTGGGWDYPLSPRSRDRIWRPGFWRPGYWRPGQGRRFEVVQSLADKTTRVAQLSAFALTLLALGWLAIAERGTRRFSLLIDPSSRRVVGRSRRCFGRDVALEAPLDDGSALRVVARSGAPARLVLDAHDGNARVLIEAASSAHAKDLAALVARVETARQIGRPLYEIGSGWRRFTPTAALVLLALTLAGAILVQQDRIAELDRSISHCGGPLVRDSE